jgi:hypothetical protein
MRRGGITEVNLAVCRADKRQFSMGKFHRAYCNPQAQQGKRVYCQPGRGYASHNGIAAIMNGDVIDFGDQPQDRVQLNDRAADVDGVVGPKALREQRLDTISDDGSLDWSGNHHRHSSHDDENEKQGGARKCLQGTTREWRAPSTQCSPELRWRDRLFGSTIPVQQAGSSLRYRADPCV